MALHCFLLDAFWNLNKICQNLHNYFSNFSINLHFITCFKLFLFSFEENVCFHRCFWLWGGSDNGTTLSKVLCRLLVTGLLWMVVAFTILFVFQLLDLVNSLFYIYFHKAKFVWFFFSFSRDKLSSTNSKYQLLILAFEYTVENKFVTRLNFTCHDFLMHIYKTNTSIKSLPH